MNGRRFDLVALGECMVELHAGEPLGEAAQLTRAFGGDVLNALASAARHGGRTGFITRVGDDPFGPSLLRQWRQLGIDTEQAPLAAGDNGVYFISLLEGGEREFTYRRKDSAASRIAAADLDAAYIASANCILLSGITQAISDSAMQATLAAARIARAYGVKVAYDPNYRPRLWAERGGLDAARRAFNALLPLVDILLPSHPTDFELFAAAPVLAAHPGLELAIKCGAEGSLLMLPNGPLCIAPAEATVVDTTGAGDAWNGAYLLHRMRGADAERAATLANQAAAAKLAHRGAIPPYDSSSPSATIN